MERGIVWHDSLRSTIQLQEAWRKHSVGNVWNTQNRKFLHGDVLLFGMKIAGMAQLVEHFLGKEKVSGSIPLVGSKSERDYER